MLRGETRFGKDIPPYVSADGENLLSGVNAIESLEQFSKEISKKIERWRFCRVALAINRSRLRQGLGSIRLGEYLSGVHAGQTVGDEAGERQRRDVKSA